MGLIGIIYFQLIIKMIVYRGRYFGKYKDVVWSDNVVTVAKELDDESVINVTPVSWFVPTFVDIQDQNAAIWTNEREWRSGLPWRGVT